MSENQKFRINRPMILRLMKGRKLHNPDIEELSSGLITVQHLKYLISEPTAKTDGKRLKMLACILECDTKDLIDPDDLISENISSETNFMIRNLYIRKREDIQVLYTKKIEDFKTDVKLAAMIEETRLLFKIFSDENIYIDEELIVKAMNLIITFLRNENCISSSQLTALTFKEANELFEHFNKSKENYHPHQLLLVFAYVMIHFDAIFLVEAIASAAQLMPERTNKETASQYFELTRRSENIRNTLLDLILYRRGVFDKELEKNGNTTDIRFEGETDTLSIDETGLDYVLIESITLMLAACEKCYQHLKGDFTDSEYVNRAVLGAIIKRLEGTFEKIGVKIAKGTFADMVSSRFGKNYFNLRLVFDSLKPHKYHVSPKEKGYLEGYKDASETALFNLLISNYQKEK